MSVALFAGCSGHAPPSAPQRPSRPPSPSPSTSAAVPSNVPELETPVLRVGLKTDAGTVVFSGKSHIYFSDGSRTAGVPGEIHAGLSFLPRIAMIYSVQVGSFSEKVNAEQAKQQFASRVKYPAFLFHNPDMNRWQLRAGPFDSKEAAQAAIEDLKGNDYPGAFYVEETDKTGAMPDLVLRDQIGNVVARTSRAVHLWTDEGSLEIDGKKYRGQVMALVNQTGRITVVNRLNMEDYLKGVVPNEIGPASESAYEALKAQAVAARTYAEKNLKQFEADGYDICATPRCQVYSGMETEHPLTSRAVEETKGEIVTYQGEAINALYTSTCGGRTEAAGVMFEGWNYPYLQGVKCDPEDAAVYQGTVEIHGRSRPWWQSWLESKTGLQVNSVEGMIDSIEAQKATGMLLAGLGKSACSETALSGNDWISVGNYLVGALCWKPRVDSLLNEKDYGYFLSHLDFSLAPSPETHAFLFLFHDGILLPPDLSQFDPYQPMPVQEFYKGLYRILYHYHQINSVEGQVREISSQEVQIVDDLGVHTFPLGSSVFTYQKMGDTRTPREKLPCGPGDRVEYYLQDGELGILVCELDAAGTSADRASKYSFWHEQVTPGELGKRVGKYLDVGDVMDLQPLSYGDSGRLAELRVVGTRSSGVLKGIRIRWALGLKDNLFVIDRMRDDSGNVKQFLFSGRGWGHGIGMCQVGALGFAKGGKDYRFILQHYYTGVQISRAY